MNDADGAPLSLASTPHRVRITTDGITSTVQLGDVDLSDQLRAFTLEQRLGQPPMLVLYAAPHRDGAVFDGLAHVVVGEEQPAPAQLIADFLTSLDPQALEQAALDREDLGDDRYALARAMLQQAADWAQGKTT
ncbi:hypothetical protein ACF06X_33325 [Streptomyces sp. NPDC015346]|uniref:hypothetical protein n=1 Tax=Streptomyces sp. NPDC015346 TaxID=3364954 RepID=UPI0036FA4704